MRRGGRTLQRASPLGKRRSLVRARQRRRNDSVVPLHFLGFSDQDLRISAATPPLRPPCRPSHLPPPLLRANHPLTLSCLKSHSSPVSPARMVPIWPNSCFRRVTRCTASFGVHRRSTPVASTTSTPIPRSTA